MIEAAAIQSANAAPEEKPIVDEAVALAMGGAQKTNAPPADVRRGRRLLRHELFRRLRPLQAVDAFAFVQINQLPHTPLSDRLMSRLSWVMTGGTGWLFVLALGVMLNRWRSSRRCSGALAGHGGGRVSDQEMVPPPPPFRFAGSSNHRGPQTRQLFLSLRPQRGCLRWCYAARKGVSRGCSRLLRAGRTRSPFAHLSRRPLSRRCRQRLLGTVLARIYSRLLRKVSGAQV